MTTQQFTKAVLTETMARLARQIREGRDRLIVEAGIMALATRRMVMDDERAYETALAAYRTIVHPHARAPRGCRI